jgi:hypothetical protein
MAHMTHHVVTEETESGETRRCRKCGVSNEDELKAPCSKYVRPIHRPPIRAEDGKWY